MSLIDRIKQQLSGNLIDGWEVLETIEQLDELDVISGNKPVILFKHSTRCGLSASAKFRLEREWNQLDEIDHSFFYLDLIRNRAVSNTIAERYTVRHQSPQIIILKNGQAIYNTSHHNISIANIRDNLEIPL